MKKITTSSLIAVLVVGLIAYILIYFIFDKTKLDKPNFTVKLPIKKEEMKIPPQECTKFLNVNPYACDK